jgi:hypothetical protein
MRANRFGQPWYEAAVEQSLKDWIRVDSWAVEKLCKAVDALASARDTYHELPLGVIKKVGSLQSRRRMAVSLIAYKTWCVATPERRLPCIQYSRKC